MNSIPFAFYDSVTRRMCTESLVRCCEMPVLIGTVASQNNQKIGYEKITIDNGRLVRTTYLTYCDNKEVASINPNYRKFTSFCIKETGRQQSIDADTIGAIEAYQKVAVIDLHFFTPTIGHKLEECIASLRFVSMLYFSEGTADLIPRIMRKFVPRKTLTMLYFHGDYKFDEESALLLLDALKQGQFNWASLPSNSCLILKKIIAEWKKTPQKFIGKRVYSEMSLDNPSFQKSIQRGNIRGFSEEEKRSQELYYPHFNGKNLMISMNWKCGTIYWKCDDTEDIELLFA